MPVGPRAFACVALIASLVSARSATAACVGDCDGDGSVAINELIRGVAIALGNAPLADCSGFDTDANGSVTIGELIAAVNAALAGCPSPTPVASGSISPTPTRTPAPTMPPPTVTAPPLATPTASASPARDATSTPTRSATATATTTPTLPTAAAVLIAGPEFQVNDYTSGDQTEPAVCRAADGRFVVTWASGGRGIRAQRYAGDGARVGDELAIGALSSPAPRAPAVSCAGDGSFVSVWQDGDGAGAGIAARRFSSDGSALGGAFLVNSYTTGDQTAPDVCSGSGGDFTVVWQSDGQDGSGGGVFAQRYDSAGGRSGTELQVNLGTANLQGQPAIACAPSASPVAVWSDLRNAFPNGQIGGRRLAGGGPAQEFFAGQMSSENPIMPDVVQGTNGDFIVAWEADRTVSDFNDPQRVYAQRYTSGGSAAGGLLEVGYRLGTTEALPAMTRGAGGDFVVAWQGAEVPICKPGAFCSNDSNCGDQQFPNCRGSQCCTDFEPQPGTNISAQQFADGGVPVGGVLTVSAPASLSNIRPAIAGDPAATFLVVWDSDGQDGSGRGVRGRLYTQLAPQGRGVLSPCQGSGDAWTFAVAAGQQIQVGVDTLEPGSAADLCFHADCGSFSFSGDDEVPCRFAPSSFACPRRELIAPASATCTVTVSVCSAICTDPGRATYALYAAVDGRAAALQFAGASGGQTPTGTPKVTPTPSPTPTHPASERKALSIAVFRSLNDKVYLLVLPVAGRRTQITSAAISANPVRFFSEQFDPTSTPVDLVLTSFAGTQGGSNLPLGTLLRGDVVSGLTDPLGGPPVFDPCANSGEGLLTFASGQQVSFLGPAPNQPTAPAVVPVASASPLTPAGVVKRIVRRNGQDLAMTEAIVFPNPPATCVGGGSPGIACLSDLACGPGALCGQTSQPPTCHGDPNVVCDPTQPTTCFLGGPCDNLGGEVAGQDVTLDDTLDSPIGNPAVQEDGADGFRLAGDCSDATGCQAMVFMLDGTGLATVNVAAAGFLLDDGERVVGTASGMGQPGAGLSCAQPREFLVNSQTAGTQGSAAVCQTPAGDTVVTWAGAGIGAQRYSSTGVALSSELTVNTAASGTQSAPSICCGGDGGFVIAWGGSGQGDDGGVFARRYASTGQPLGDEFQVNTYTSGSQTDPAITCLPDGGFLAAWTSGSLAVSQDGSDSGIYAQYFTGTGAKRGDEFRVNTVTMDTQLFPAVCSSPDGSAAVAWTSRGYLSAPFATAVQQYASDGSPRGGEQSLLVNSSHLQFHPAVACRPDGSAIVVDEEFMPCNVPPPMMCGIDGSGYAVFIDGGSRVNSSTLGDQRSPAVATDGSGNALVVWTSDGSPAGILGQRYDSTGAPLGSEFQLNASPGGTQSEPAVSCDADGRCVAVWTAPDGSDTGVYAQRLSFGAN